MKNNEIKIDETTFQVDGKQNPKNQIDKLKASGTFNPITDTVKVTENEELVNKPKIKYLSNIKDDKGCISKPFSIDGKNYQLVRGINEKKEKVNGVYCLDETDENGTNIIHPTDYFDENIAKKHVHQEKSKTDTKEADILKHLNLLDVQGFKHFFVNIKTGVITGKFKSNRDMVKSGQKLGPDEDYMTINDLKKFRLGSYFKNDVSEDTNTDGGNDGKNDGVIDGVNVPKLKSDVNRVVNAITTKFSNILVKLDKPIEQAQFLSAMAEKIGVPLNKLAGIISSYKDIANNQEKTKDFVATENTLITKNQLIESLNKRNILRTIKVKDIK